MSVLELWCHIILSQFGKGYMYVGMCFAAKYLRISRSVPYQLNPTVLYPIRGKWTEAVTKANKVMRKLQGTTIIFFNKIKRYT